MQVEREKDHWQIRRATLPSRPTRGRLAPSHAAGRPDDGLDAPDADVHGLARHGGVARLEHLLGSPAPAEAEEEVEQLLHVLLRRLRLEAGLHLVGVRVRVRVKGER